MAIDMYEKVAKNIAPKRESLHKAEVDHHESLEQLTRKKQQLREAQEKLKSVHDDMQVLFAIPAKKLFANDFILVRLTLQIDNLYFNIFNLQQKKQKKAELENEVELCSRKLERAEQLITGMHISE